MEMLSRDLSYLVEVKDGLISLTPLQLCARDIEVVLGDVGKLPVAELESQYEAKFGRELPLEPLGFESVSELLAAMNDTLSVSGRGIRYSYILELHTLNTLTLRKIVRVNKSATPTLSPSRPSSLVLPQLVSQPALSGATKPSSVASFSGRGFDMIRALPPQSAPRIYAGVAQAAQATPGGDVNMNFSKMIPPPNINIASSCSTRGYHIPPPSYLQSYPPPSLAGSPQSNYLNHNFIPTAAPNSPATPTTPRTFNYPFPIYSFFPSKHVDSPMSTSPKGSTMTTFQQHMMKHSPSPLITNTSSPYIIQPISRSSPELDLARPVQAEELSQSISKRLNFGIQSTIEPSPMSSSVSMDNYF